MAKTDKKFDEKMLDSLLERGANDEAKKYIEEFFMTPSDPKQAAEVAIDYAHIYMKAMNRINRAHLESLHQIEKLLAETNKAQKKTEDSFQLAKLKAGLRQRN